MSETYGSCIFFFFFLNNFYRYPKREQKIHLAKLLVSEFPNLATTIDGKEAYVSLPGAPNSAKFRGVAEGQPRFDKGGVAIIFTFYALKISLFRVFAISD